MPNITTRAGKGAPLNFQELDANFNDLNQSVEQLELNKYDSSDLATETQARLGQDNTTLMTPLRVAQAVDAQTSNISIGLVIALS